LVLHSSGTAPVNQARVTTTSPNASPNRDAGNTIPSKGDANGDAIPSGDANGDANTPE
jgi:hypothetical protein